MAEPAKNGGVQSVGRVLDLLEIVGDAGRRDRAERAGRAVRPAAALDPPAGAHPGRARLHAPAAEPPVRARRPPGPARPGRGHDARRVGAAGADRAGRRPGRDREPRRPRPRRGRCTSARCPPGTRCGCSPSRAAGSQPHCTGVGKALLSSCPDEAVRELLARTGMPAADARTRSPIPTRCSPSWPGSAATGHAIDEGEQEIGVRCVAVPVHGRARHARHLGLRTGPADDPGADRPRRPPAPRGRRAAVVGDRRALDGLTGPCRRAADGRAPLTPPRAIAVAALRRRPPAAGRPVRATRHRWTSYVTTTAAYPTCRSRKYHRDVMNRLPDAHAAEQLRACNASPRWIEQVLAHRPYADRETVLRHRGARRPRPRGARSAGRSTPTPHRGAVGADHRGAVVAAGAVRGRHHDPTPRTRCAPATRPTSTGSGTSS